MPPASDLHMPGQARWAQPYWVPSGSSTSSGPGALPLVPPGRSLGLGWASFPSHVMPEKWATTFFLWGQVYLEIVPKLKNNLLNETDRVSERRECFFFIQELDGLNSPGGGCLIPVRHWPSINTKSLATSREMSWDTRQLWNNMQEFSDRSNIYAT